MKHAKRVHRANFINDEGGVSALCSATPKPIDLRRATWTNRDDAVTCPRCKFLLKMRPATP